MGYRVRGPSLLILLRLIFLLIAKEMVTQIKKQGFGSSSSLCDMLLNLFFVHIVT